MPTGGAQARFLAIVLTALALVPAGAHLAELPNKIGLDQRRTSSSEHLSRLGSVRRRPVRRWRRALAIGPARGRRSGWRRRPSPGAATLAIFFIWTYPANQATSNWTVVPPTGKSCARRGSMRTRRTRS
jgi:hypothetical protein